MALGDGAGAGEAAGAGCGLGWFEARVSELARRWFKEPGSCGPARTTRTPAPTMATIVSASNAQRIVRMLLFVHWPTQRGRDGRALQT